MQLITYMQRLSARSDLLLGTTKGVHAWSGYTYIIIIHAYNAYMHYDFVVCTGYMTDESICS